MKFFFKSNEAIITTAAMVALAVWMFISNPIPYLIAALIYYIYLFIGVITGTYFIKKTTGNASFAAPAFFIAYLSIILLETHLLAHSFFDTWQPWSNVILNNYFFANIFYNFSIANILIVVGVFATRVAINLIGQTPIIWTILQFNRNHKVSFKKVIYSVFMTSLIAIGSLVILLIALLLLHTTIAYLFEL